MREIVCDNFAGGGGASVGIERALGVVDVAINHDQKALAIHRANHPKTKHFNQSINKIDPLDATEGRPVGLAWFSPDCKHFSKAKGGRPVQKEIRDLAWVVPHWAQRVRPRVIILENVEEFTTWGPLDPDTNRPCKARKGLEFRRWIRAIRRLGYKVEWRELKACDYGTPTTRKRLFLIARCDGRPIVWPAPSHGPGLKPYRSAAECLDWSLSTRSIFNRPKPLAENTLRRIARGIVRFVLEVKNPFLIGHLMTYRKGYGSRSLMELVPTLTTESQQYVVSPWFISRYGERLGQEPRVRDTQRPMPTVVPTGNGANLCAAYLAQHNTGATGHPVTEPVSTICSSGTHQQLVASHLTILRNNCYGQSVEKPIRTISAGGTHFGEVRTFLDKYALGREPVVSVGSTRYVIADIQMRMLSPRELFRAQGFPDSYVIAPEFNGKPMTKKAQYSACGNSVCPQVAESLVRANVQLRDVCTEEEPLIGGLFG